MRTNPQSLRATLRHLREASAGREYTPPDPSDLEAVRRDDARKVFGFLKIRVEDEGGTMPDHLNSVAKIYALARKLEAREGGD